MSTSNQLDYVARCLSGAVGDQLVFVDAQGRPQLCPAGGVRAQALQKCLPPRYRILGVFSPGVSALELARCYRVAA